MAAEPHTDFKLDRITLRYRDAALEAEYMQYAPQALIRTVKPVVMSLLPILVLMAVFEITGLIDMPADWTSAAGVAVLLAVLLLVALYAPRFIEHGILLVFVCTTALLLSYADTEAQFERMMPGLIMVVLLSNYVHIRYLFGIVGSLVVMAIVGAWGVSRGFDQTPLIDAGLFLVIGLVSSISISYTIDRQRRRLFAQVKLLAQERDNHERLALHDSLTGLPNRLLLRERMGQSLARAKRHHGQFAVLFVDLDDFKSVNDSYGHAVGDEVLRQIAANLQERVRDEDTVARIGGDEFVILSEHVQDDHGAKIAASRIQEAVAHRVVAQSNRSDLIHIQVTCSIGIALCPRDGDSLDDLINRADSAMYRAKRAGKDTTQFFRQDDKDGSRGARSVS